jgi:hypothetical protein
VPVRPGATPLPVPVPTATSSAPISSAGALAEAGATKSATLHEEDDREEFPHEGSSGKDRILAILAFVVSLASLVVTYFAYVAIQP